LKSLPGLGVIEGDDIAQHKNAWLKDLMRHSDIRTTMNVYGGVLDHTMREYNWKVVSMALRV
jgi:integrase